jgi:hypothetical protein
VTDADVNAEAGDESLLLRPAGVSERAIRARRLGRSHRGLLQVTDVEIKRSGCSLRFSVSPEHVLNPPMSVCLSRLSSYC